jgi:hypothetical protein
VRAAALLEVLLEFRARRSVKLAVQKGSDLFALARGIMSGSTRHKNIIPFKCP